MVVRLVCAGAIFLAASQAGAVVPRGAPDALTALPAAGITKPLRAQPALRAGVPPPAFTGHWQVLWDAATGVPAQVWGEGIAAPGASDHADVAEGVARRVL